MREILTSIFDKFPTPNCAATLGWTLLYADPATGELHVQFDGKAGFTNPQGFIQGGFLTAMMDDTLGPTILVKSNGEKSGLTIDLHTHFLRPAKIGVIIGKAKLIKMGKNVAFMEGHLEDEQGKIIAKATASASIIDLTA